MFIAAQLEHVDALNLIYILLWFDFCSFLFYVFGFFGTRNQSHWVRIEILRRTPPFLRPELAYEVKFDKNKFYGIVKDNTLVMGPIGPMGPRGP